MADHNSQPIKISKNKPALNFPKITKNPIFRDRGKVLFVDGKICVTRNRRHHPDQKLSRADICVRTRLPSPFSERVNPYVAPRHVIARYCAITLHLAVIQMHRGPIGETPEGQKSSTFLPDLHLPPKVDRPRIQILAGQSATHPGLLIFFSLGHHSVEIVSTIRSFRLIRITDN